jgi:UDP-glucose 4-epimerase
MRLLVTGSSGHLGEALAVTLGEAGHAVVGLDLLPGPATSEVGSILDRSCLRRCLAGARRVFHAATLHRPHVESHSRQDFVDTNITGTLNLLEEAVAAGVEAFVLTSTTSVFGDALVPPPGAPAAWIDETLAPVARNIYGATKAAAEDLCRLFSRNDGLACVALRTARFFPEEDFDAAVRAAYAGDNIKVNEYLYRRVDLEDVVGAHLLAAERAPALGFARYIISATTPFTQGDLADLRLDAAAVARRHVPEYEAEFESRGWRMVPRIDRVYVNERARRELGWQPRWDFRCVIGRLAAGEDYKSALARRIGAKGYPRAQ